MDEDELINNAGHGDLGMWTKKLIAVSLFTEHIIDEYVLQPHYISDCASKIRICRRTCKNCDYVEKQEL